MCRAYQRSISDCQMREGNKNAQKGTFLRTSHVHIRVTPRQKTRWVKAALMAGVPLSELIEDTVERAAHKMGVAE